jgi:hypothetical protein
LVLGDTVTYRNFPFDNFAFYDAFANLWEFKYKCHFATSVGNCGHRGRVNFLDVCRDDRKGGF